MTTEPGGTGRFLAAVHQLRTDVERMVGDVTERVDALATRVETLQEALADAQRAQRDATPRAPDWPALKAEDPDECDRLWNQMSQWISSVLVPRYPKVKDKLPLNCWWRHPDVVDTVTAAWTAWRSAYGPQARPTDALNWHRDARSLIERQLAETWPGNGPFPECHVHGPRRHASS